MVRSWMGVGALVTAVLAWGCGGDETGSSGGGGTDGSGAAAGTGASSGTGTGSGTATGTATGNGGSCGLDIVGTPCSAGATCGWAAGCIEGSCECDGGTWACITSDTCQGQCPQASETGCGDPCTGSASGCLCRCGGGPNFSACECSGGEWVCSACGG